MDPRDQTFMTIHNLTPDANILFASDSILDILGYHPDEVKGQTCFAFFHPDEVPFARSIHSRGVLMDKAAVLHYARIRSKSGEYVNCECCFTVVHTVLVASISIYLRGDKSERRAKQAPEIRRKFSCSPLDPRYHMLEHLSPKFKMPAMEREPRAALILNRFSLALNVMYATPSVAQIIGIHPDELMDKSFYDCIQQHCMEQASRCLERAKENESIAYLRFWYKDPRADLEHEGDGSEDGQDEDEDLDDASSRGNSDKNDMDIDDDDDSVIVIKDEEDDRIHLDSRESSTSSATSASSNTQPLQQSPRTFELEAVVSCTSDGLVVVLRRARPPIPDLQPVVPSAFSYQNGLFAAPWAQQPVEPYIPPDLLYTFRPPFLPQYMPLRESVKAAGGPPMDHLMRSIRDVAVFAWALSGINGNMANYGRGMPRRGAQPPDGLSAWDPNGNNREQDKAYEVHHHPSVGAPHGYVRTRHASLDDGMYGNHQQYNRSSWSPPAAVSSPYRYGAGYEASQQQQQLRSMASYNTLQHHTPQQQQQQQQQQQHHHQQHRSYYSPQLQPQAGQGGPARCQLQTPQWGEPSSSHPSITNHGPLPPNTGEPSASTRYFWQ
ncbi:hypothetical protein QBC40DRAFT_2700 [Triangularia verruculosa]|uniref:PAS domain-containing protein n=1 Tax=Triangularia verruculosa TaxID=2587418 RepID=A0AAN6XT69_9PEZI|nr:hypothetical protein QBC40DRAFT_2700 [Triangularia verruculosa]